MPTNASEAVLNRALSKAQGASQIANATALLRELVNYATTSLEQCAAAATKKESEDVATFVLYLHIIEMMDGIEVLLSESAPIPAHPLLRSAFEAALSLEYILERDTEYGQRSLAWFVGRIHDDLSMLERMDPSTQRGKEFQATQAKDKLAAGMSGLPQADVQKEIARLQTLLADSEFQPIEAEYARCRAAEKRKPEWYHLFGGPANIIDLARHLKRGAQYEILYRPWSGVVHAQDYSRFLAAASGGGLEVKRLRDPKDIRYVIELAASIFLEAIAMVTRKFLSSDQQLRDWFVKEVVPLYNKL